MTQAEIQAQIAAYRDAVDVLTHHAGICTDAHALAMDTATTLQRRIVALEHQAADALRALNAKASGGKPADRKGSK